MALCHQRGVVKGEGGGGGGQKGCGPRVCVVERGVVKGWAAINRSGYLGCSDKDTPSQKGVDRSLAASVKYDCATASVS